MLVIREDQIEAFRQQNVERLIACTISYIRTEHPTHYARLGADGTRAFVERCIAAARRFGIDTDGATAVVTELWLIYGETLERAPDREWARNILAHKELPGYIKAETLQNRISERMGGRVLVAFPPG